MRLEDAGFGKLGLWVFTALILVPLIVYGFLSAEYVAHAAGGGVEFNAVSLWLPQNMYGQLGVINVPLNVSSTNLLSYTNTYVIDEAGKPYYSYLFSSNPPLVSILDGALSAKTYSVFYGGTNPYSSFVAVPGQVPIYASYDDFDYDSGMWNYVGHHSIAQSSLYLTNGSATLNTSYTPNVVALWKLRAAGTAYAIVLESPYNYSGWVLIHLDSQNFGDWGSVINGWDDVFFTDMQGNPLNYSIAYANVTAKELDAYVLLNLTANTPQTIIMFYGRNNPYTNYRTPISQIITQQNKQANTATTKTEPRITYPNPTKTITINQTNINITAGTALAPHLYNWYFPLDGAHYIIWNYASELWGANASYALDTVIKPVTYTPNNYPSFISVVQPNVITNLRFYHAQSGGIWVSAPGRIMGAGVTWGSWQRVYFVYYYSNTSILLMSYVNGSRKSAWPANSYNYGPTRVGVGDGAHSPEMFLAYVTLYSPNASIPSSLEGYVLDSTKLKVLLDPTFFNGSVYFDLVNGVVGVPYGGVFRVPANKTWVWVVDGLYSDGYVHLRFFPVGSVVRFFVNGSLVGWVVVGGGDVLPSGLVDDFRVWVPPGTYNVSVSVPVSERGFGSGGSGASLVNGLGRYSGTRATSCVAGDAYATEYGGTYWCEYGSASGEVGWYVPGYGQGTDYVTSNVGYTPFNPNYYTDYASTTNVKTLNTYYTTITQKITITWTTITQNATITPNTALAPHLWDWAMPGNISFSIAPNLSRFTLITDVNIKSLATGVWINLFNKPYSYSMKLWQDSLGTTWQVAMYNSSGTFFYAKAVRNGNIVGAGETIVWGVFNGTNLMIYRNLIRLRLVTAGPDVNNVSGSLKILSNRAFGTASYAIILSIPLTVNELPAITSNHTINYAVFMADPTFFNGSVYFDLVNGVVGVPYGGVYRVPANETWVWVVDGLYSDGYVHLRFFPNGSVIDFINASTGALVKEVVVTGTPNGAGLIPDYAVSLPAGNYTIKAHIPRQTTLAPHLYVWRGLPNTDHAIFYGYVPSIVDAYSLSVATEFFVINKSSSSYGTIIRLWHPSGHKFGVVLSQGPLYFAPGAWVNNDTNNIITWTANGLTYHDLSEHFLGWWYNLSSNSMILSLSGVGSRTFILPRGYGKLNTTVSSSIPLTLLGHPYFTGTDEFVGYLYYVIVWSYTKNTTEWRLNDFPVVFNASFLADPTFFNGTDYFDLITGNVGTVRGTVERVPANRTWVWVVPFGVSYSEDGFVVFRFFPAGTVVRVFSSSGVPVREFVISGSVNGAGLVPVFKVPASEFPAGTYTFVFLIPRDGVSVSSSSVSFIGARDSYVLLVNATYASWGFGEAFVGATFEGVWGRSVNPVLVWGSTPVSWGLGVPDGYVWSNVTVIEARLYVPAGTPWEFAVYNITEVGDKSVVGNYSWSSPAVDLRVLSNGSVVLTYSPDNTSVFTGLTAPSGWVYVFMRFDVNGSLVIGVGPGNYPSLYDSVSTYTYKAVKWGAMAVMPVIGVDVPNGTSKWVYIDWLRVRPKAFTVSVAGGATLYPLRSWESVVDRVSGPAEWVFSVESAHFIAVTLSNFNTTFTTVAVGGVPQVLPGGYAWLSRDGEAVVLNGSDVLVSKALPITAPFSGDVVIDYDDVSGNLTVSLVVSGGKSYLLVTDHVGRLGRSVGVYVATDSAVFGHAWFADKHAVDDVLHDTFSTVASAPGTLSSYEVGWTYSAVVNNVSTWVNVSVTFNGTGVYLRATTSWGSVKEVFLGKSASPCDVVVGYDFDNTTSTLIGFAMYVWMSKNYTHYDVAEVSLSINESVPYMYPYVGARNSSVIVDKFAVTVGNVLEDLSKGIARVKIAGPVSVGGMVKYVSLNSPVRIEFTGSSVVVTPTEGSGITLVGFRGWTLNLAVSGTSVSGVTITSDTYHIDVPLGFTAMIIADPSTRQVSIVSASPPSQNVKAVVTQGERVGVTFATPPSMTVSPLSSFTSFTNIAILTATFIALGLAAYRLTGEVGMSLVVPSVVSLILFAVLGQWPWVGVAVIALVAGLGVRTASQ